MKTTIFLMLIFLITTFSFSQEVDVIEANTLISMNNLAEVDTNLTFAIVYNDVKQALSGLASGLEIGGEHVYKILVRQQTIRAFKWTIIGILFIISILLFLYFLNKGNKNDWDDGNIIYSVLLGMVVCIFGIGFFVLLDSGLTGFFNPEYGAIQEILEFAQKLKGN